MQEIESHRRLPDGERLSLLSATILLAYALGRFIQLPSMRLGVQLPGFYLGADVEVQALVSLMVAGLTAAGTAWLLQDHPALQRVGLLEHILLPSLTAWAISLPLFQTPLSLQWWVVFALGGVLIILVLMAEYLVVDPQDARRGMASAGLTVLSFVLFLILAAALRYSELRLYLLVPAVGLAGGLVSLRALRLRRPNRWSFLEAGLAAFSAVQLAAALHYWPLTPVSFGLALLGPAYALTSLFGNLAEDETLRQAAVEPAVILVIIWGAAIWLH